MSEDKVVQSSPVTENQEMTIHDIPIKDLFPYVTKDNSDESLENLALTLAFIESRLKYHGGTLQELKGMQIVGTFCVKGDCESRCQDLSEITGELLNDENLKEQGWTLLHDNGTCPPDVAMIVIF